MKVSILIANYNNGKYFKECYGSVLAQSYQNWECIIVDDCSTDDSVAIIKKMIGDDSRFRFFQNDKNEGCGYTKSRCVELAQGEICGFLDPDDMLEPNALEVMVNAHRENPEVALVHSKWKAYDENWNFIRNYTGAKHIHYSRDFYNEESEITAFAAFKKEFYNKTGGILPELQRAVDQDLYLKLCEVGSTLYIDKFLYKYRLHRGGISTFENQEKAAFWRWAVILDAAKRRKINIEDKFVDRYVSRNRFNEASNLLKKTKKSRLIKLLQQLGFLRYLK